MLQQIRIGLSENIKNQYLVDDHAHKNELRMQVDETRTLIIDADFRRITGTVKYVGREQKVFMPM